MVKDLKKFKRVIFDFDNTLFDTEAIKECFWEIAKIHGFSPDETIILYREARQKNARITITMESFLSVIKEHLPKGKDFLDREVFEIVKKMENAGGLLPGAKKILEYCQRNNIERYILSVGIHDWQEKKLQLSGIKKYFDSENILFTEDCEIGKESVLLKKFGSSYKGEDTVFFNDKPDETERLLRKFPKMVVFLRRETRDKRYGERDFMLLADKHSEQLVWAEDLNLFVNSFKTLF